MGLWQSVSLRTATRDMTDEVHNEVMTVVDQWADRSRELMIATGLVPHSSPLGRPFNLVLVRDARTVWLALTRLQGGMPTIICLDRPNEEYNVQVFEDFVVRQQGMELGIVVSLPRPDAMDRAPRIEALAKQHLEQLRKDHLMTQLGNVSHVQHLEHHLRQFMAIYPDFDRNVFVMMRFHETAQFDEIYTAIKSSLKERGFTAVRADDRDYTGELWSNIEVYMACCRYGIAVFENIEESNFNPNVALELGYLLARRKRCLILKEKRLSALPADVIHRLYKPFDAFDIANSVRREVGRWVDVDLDGGAA